MRDPLHPHEWGPADGAPVVCLHGVTGHGARFRRLAERLPGRRVVALDLRGHGRSPWVPPWDTAAHARDALETVAALGLGRCDWIGFSFGARVLATLAAAAPDGVGRLCLLEPALSLPAIVCLERAELEREELTFGSAEEAIEQELSSGLLLSTPRELLEEEMLEHLVRRGDGRLEYRYCRSAAVAAWGEMAAPPPAVARAPTLVVRGEGSWVGLDEERLRAELGGGLRAETVPGGHSLLWDALEPTAAALAAFLC